MNARKQQRYQNAVPVIAWIGRRIERAHNEG